VITEVPRVDLGPARGSESPCRCGRTAAGRTRRTTRRGRRPGGAARSGDTGTTARKRLLQWDVRPARCRRGESWSWHETRKVSPRDDSPHRGKRPEVPRLPPTITAKALVGEPLRPACARCARVHPLAVVGRPRVEAVTGSGPSPLGVTGGKQTAVGSGAYCVSSRARRSPTAPRRTRRSPRPVRRRRQHPGAGAGEVQAGRISTVGGAASGVARRPLRYP